MRMLIVEDDDDIREFLKENLEAECFAVDTVSEGERGSFLARCNDYDVIVLDYLLPKKNGLEVCKEIRASGKNTPIVMLSIQSAAPKKIELFKAGVDDYLTKPFSLEELKARIQAILRRSKTIEPDILFAGNVSLDTSRQKVFRDKKDIYLTRKEFTLMEYLMRNAGKVVSRGMIMEHVWNDDIDPFSNTIEAHILNLRKKIDSKHKVQVIRTIPGRGYTIEV